MEGIQSHPPKHTHSIGVFSTRERARSVRHGDTARRLLAGRALDIFCSSADPSVGASTIDDEVEGLITDLHRRDVRDV